ncbi:hypothetical protein [Clostridioides difficile]|uniref:hypothetical protein n=1 Tax=Clostridioides difficile TaxID=1496 RepID=UPI003F8D4CD7
MWGMIATWRMALEGITEASEHLEKGMEAGDAVELAVRRVKTIHSINRLDMVDFQMKIVR